jgi:hypothetical protein
MTFTAGNWNTPQTATITGVNDVAQSNDSANITASINAESSDDDFDLVADQAVSVTCTDDESTGDSGSNTPPVVAPIANQIINLGSSDPGAPSGDIILVRENFGGDGSDLAGTDAGTYDSVLTTSGGSSTWGGSANVKMMVLLGAAMPRSPS